MVRRVVGRILGLGALALVVTAPPLVVGTALPAAAAGPAVVRPEAGVPHHDVTAANRRAPAQPDAVTITGDGLAEPITVRVTEQPDRFASVLSQVGWLPGAPAQPAGPPADKLGPKYTAVVLVKDQPVKTYDLYPLAEGGARAYRPAQQPDKSKTTAGWIYARLNMSEALRTAGAPLPERPDVVSGGIGGGERINAQEVIDPSQDVNRFLGQLRQVLLLNVGVLLTITLGLAGMALLIRRKI